MITVDNIAMVAHEANAMFCRVQGDHSQNHWRQAEAWQRESAIKGVEFALANPDAPDSAQHDAWMADKIAAGWVYGEVKDAEAKTHPCIVAFEDLPVGQKVKDTLFRAVVAALAPMLEESKQKTA